ncbi:hypothetical protein HMPREF9178_0915 [Streptococcus mitis bv. 2 str. F0392]|uniref:Uncharacterized protein n=1 Tax=Streptococcus mitis bv. 2 str. F0392 TaxID=768726 RepID=F9NZ50_STROR|nr:hypothetical protein HMPREF9178_0915 [Streptococcus mitis bv. 2 str. F0392]
MYLFVNRSGLMESSLYELFLSNRFFHPQTEVTFLNCDKIEGRGYSYEKISNLFIY